MRNNNLKVTDTFVIFYYDIFKKENIFFDKIGIKIHSLCTWYDVINEIKKTGALESKEIEKVEKFLYKPS